MEPGHGVVGGTAPSVLVGVDLVRRYSCCTRKRLWSYHGDDHGFDHSHRSGQGLRQMARNGFSNWAGHGSLVRGLVTALVMVQVRWLVMDLVMITVSALVLVLTDGLVIVPVTVPSELVLNLFRLDLVAALSVMPVPDFPKRSWVLGVNPTRGRGHRGSGKSLAPNPPYGQLMIQDRSSGIPWKKFRNG